MKELLGSQVKEQVLLYLGLRGGTSGRRLARLLKKSPTQIFKALHPLLEAGVIAQYGSPPFYALNQEYIYYDELVRIIYKKYHAAHHRSYLPKIAADRHINPFAVYEMHSLLDRGPPVTRLSEALRSKLA